MPHSMSFGLGCYFRSISAATHTSHACAGRSMPRLCCNNSTSSCASVVRRRTRHVCVNGATSGAFEINKSRTATGRRKTYDVLGLSNLCLDVVVPVPQLPAAKDHALLEQLAACSHDTSSWELGGNCNFMIAAARMGMIVGSVGHVGDDVYGQYMNQVLQV